MQYFPLTGTKTTLIALGILALLALGVFLSLRSSTKPAEIAALQGSPAMGTSTQVQTMLVAGGCFWCVEADLEKLPGVIDVVSGYAGGTTENPTYRNYSAGGHREVVEVTYDANVVSYARVAEYALQHTDPTDAGGTFYDRGQEYRAALYYENDQEREAAEQVIEALDASGAYSTPVTAPVIERPRFWPAEDYHQDYYQKSSLKYGYYRRASGRDAFITKHWGKEPRSVLPAAALTTRPAMPWINFEKPSDEQLKATLTPIQYKVTQHEGTEAPFDNEYNGEKREGIYVDIVSGEPLYSSLDKYDSGTGWPSFTKPLEPENIELREDRRLFTTRTEVRSKHADSHLGHVFPDGPKDRGGLRYCMNSAALRFIPKEDLEKEGYGQYLSLFN